MAVLSIERIIPLLSLQDVVSLMTVESVILCAATDEIIAVFSVEQVFSWATVEDVIAKFGIDGVIASETREGVFAWVAIQGIVVVTGSENLGLNDIAIPDDSICEADLLYLIAIGSIIIEEAINTQEVIGAINWED